MPAAVSRRKFMALAGGSVAAMTIVAACGSDSAADVDSETSQFGDGDVGILNYLLGIEYLQADFYADLVESNLLSAAGREALGKFGEEEEEHAAALTEAIEKLEGEPAPKPKTKFALTTDVATLELARKLEDLGAAAYLSQLPVIEDRSTLAKVLSIHSVEGRHAAAIDGVRGKPFTPTGAFAKPATVKAVLRATEPFIVS